MRKVLWQDVSELVKQTDLKLWELIEAINPGADFPLFLADYHYGDYLVKEGVPQFPQGKNLLLGLDELSLATKKLLDKNRMPVGFVLTKALEIFSHYSKNIIPLKTLKAGSLVGLCELFSPNTLYVNQLNISAGVRTAFMLPNVADSTHHKKLMNIYQAPPENNSILDHWEVFKKIATYRFHNRYWLCEILFFSNPWIDKINNADTAPWLALRNYFFEQAWGQTRSLFHLYNNIYLKNHLLQIMADCQINVSEYIFDTVKYIFLMHQGYVPGFQVSDGSEDYLPEALIQEAYVQDYKLKRYLPIIMHSSVWQGGAPLYYSLNLPVILSTAMPDVKHLRKTELLQQIKQVLDRLNLTQGSRCRYMHYHADDSQGFEEAVGVFADDPRVIRLKGIYPNREISSSNPFVRGCIQLTKAQG